MLPTITPAHSGITAAEWDTAIRPKLAGYRPHLVQSTPEMFEWFFPRIPATVHRADIRTEAFDGAVKLCFAKLAQPVAGTAQEWFFGKLLPQLVTWAAEFETAFSCAELRVMAAPRTDAEELEWREPPAAWPQVGIHVRALPLMIPVCRVAGSSAAGASVVLTRRQCRSVLALAMLGAHPLQFSASVRRPFVDGTASNKFVAIGDGDLDACVVGELSFLTVMCRGTANGVGAQRLACLLQYFEEWRLSELGRDGPVGSEAHLRIDASTLNDQITFKRFANSTVDGPPDFALADHVQLFERPTVPGAAAASPNITFSAGFMESFADAEAHVDFANEQIHIGCVIPSCTQEEVMFTVRPELYLALPLYTTLLPHEAALIVDAATFARYSGYRNTFQYAGPVGDQHSLLPARREAARQSAAAARRVIPEVIVIDAHVNEGSQFESALHVRDLGKAYRGFQSSDAVVIGTGPWGCGAFAGDVTLKLMQQAMVAALCTPDRKTLRYHALTPTFFTALCYALSALEVTVGAMHRWISQFAGLRAAAARVPFSVDTVLERYDGGMWPTVSVSEPNESSAVVARRAWVLGAWERLAAETRACRLVQESMFTEFLVCKIASRALQVLVEGS